LRDWHKVKPFSIDTETDVSPPPSSKKTVDFALNLTGCGRRCGGRGGNRPLAEWSNAERKRKIKEKKRKATVVKFRALE
jgi:hypothetical protein